LDETIDALVAYCLAKPGVAPDVREDFRLIAPHSGSSFARFFRQESPPMLMVRCPDAVFGRLASVHKGLLASRRETWREEGWGWIDAPLDGTIPAGTLLDLIEGSFQIALDGLDRSGKILHGLLVRSAGADEAMRTLIAENGLARHRETILAMARPAFGIVCSPAGRAEPPLAGTRVGGRPDLEDGTEWPCHESGRPLVFVAQINLADLPTGVDAGPLPTAGLLSFFSAYGWMEEDFGEPHPINDENGSPAWSRVLYFQDSTRLGRRTPPAGVHEFPAAPAQTAPLVTFPSSPEEPLFDALRPFEEDLYAFLDDVFEPYRTYQGYAAGRPRGVSSWLMGHADFIQGVGAAAGGGRRLLLQLGSEEDAGMCWGDLGRLYFYIHPDDLARGEFSRVYTDFQCS